MTLNMAVEPLVRQGFAAAVARDAHASIAALQELQAKDDTTIRDAVTLATVICITALKDEHDGELPDGDQIRELGHAFESMERDWSAIDASTARVFFAAITGQDERGLLPADVYTRVVFVAGGWLLSSFGPDDEDWWVTLDNILVRLRDYPLPGQGV